MAAVSIYLNFPGTCEAAFHFYKSVFGTDFSHEVIRYADLPADDGNPMPDEVRNLIIHTALPILNGLQLMGADVVEMFGHKYAPGNQMYINLEPDSRQETERLYMALSEGGKVETPLQDTFWGAYFASFTDQFGVNWMVNYNNSLDQPS